MPDLLTHVAIAYGVQRCSSKLFSTSWFLVGTILPDVMTRPFNILFPSASWFFMPFHTPAGLLLVSSLISEFFPAFMRRLVFLSLIGGASLHLFLDLFQRHSGGGYYLFPVLLEEIRVRFHLARGKSLSTPCLVDYRRISGRALVSLQ
jgi:hypothetical protein